MNTTTTPLWQRYDLARIDTSGGASFPPDALLPDAAKAALEPLWALRQRNADAAEAEATARRDLDAAHLADAAALKAHVTSGGSAADFAPSTAAAEKALAAARTDLRLIGQQLAGQLHSSVAAVQACHAQGASLAAEAVQVTATRYTDAIAALVDARREYLGACSARLFWRYLTERGSATMAGGDQIITRQGPITKIDRALLQCLDLDAKTHERIADAPL